MPLSCRSRSGHCQEYHAPPPGEESPAPGRVLGFHNPQTLVHAESPVSMHRMHRSWKLPPLVQPCGIYAPTQMREYRRYWGSDVSHPCGKVYDRGGHGVCLAHSSVIVFLDSSLCGFRHIKIMHISASRMWRRMCCFHGSGERLKIRRL